MRCYQLQYLPGVAPSLVMEVGGGFNLITKEMERNVVLRFIGALQEYGGGGSKIPKIDILES